MTSLQAATLADPGLKRELNEDRVWAQIYSDSDGEPLGLFILCDGIGGHLGGDSASNWAVETIKHELRELFSPKDPRATVLLSKHKLDETVKGGETTRLSKTKKIEKMVIQAIQKANQVVHEYARQKPKQAFDAGTTITLAIVSGNRAVIANVGDSRTYLLREDNLQQITKDHSLVASLVERGQIQPEEIFNHPQRNLIYRSLGNHREVEVDTFWQVLKPGDYLLLCSDGLWEMVQDDAVMARIILEASTLDDACRQLVNAANRAGGEDNISVVVGKLT